MKIENKLKGKDLINVGIYTAIYCVLLTIVAMLGYIPIMMQMLCALGPLICGIPAILFYTKVKKFGMISIMGIIVGIFLWVTGMGYWPCIFGIVCGFLADLIAKSGKYTSSVKMMISYGVFSITLFGNFVPLYINITDYFSARQEFGEAYAASLTNIMQPWTISVLPVVCFVFGILGALLGRKVLHKHFEKAGIA